MKIGQGWDLHRLSSGLRLVIGGIEIESALGSVAHSDGDVLLHAVTDAVLGALGEGDIGELFPDTDPANLGRNSADFLLEAMHRARHQGYRTGNLDVTVITQVPRLSPYKSAIRENLARLCHCPQSAVNVKAKTHEKVDAIGHCEAIAAQAVILLLNDSTR